MRRGEIFGLLGPNGAGKTTTVECIQGLRRSDRGTIRLLGLDSQSQTGQVRQRIGCQLQESALPERIKLIPLKHANTLLQDAWLGWGWNSAESLILVGILGLALLLSIRFFRWE